MALKKQNLKKLKVAGPTRDRVTREVHWIRWLVLSHWLEWFLDQDSVFQSFILTHYDAVTYGSEAHDALCEREYEILVSRHTFKLVYTGKPNPRAHITCHDSEFLKKLGREIDAIGAPDQSPATVFRGQTVAKSPRKTKTISVENWVARRFEREYAGKHPTTVLTQFLEWLLDQEFMLQALIWRHSVDMAHECGGGNDQRAIEREYELVVGRRAYLLQHVGASNPRLGCNPSDLAYLDELAKEIDAMNLPDLVDGGSGRTGGCGGNERC